jgi:hypothetical protein
LIVDWVDLSSSGFVYPAGMSVDLVQKPAGATGALRWPAGVNNNARVDVSLPVTLAVDGSISFWVRSDGENWYDGLKFKVDGSEVGWYTGNPFEWAFVSFDVLAGAHTFTWEYFTDSSNLEGENTCWIALLTVIGDDPNNMGALYLHVTPVLAVGHDLRGVGPMDLGAVSIQNVSTLTVTLDAINLGTVAIPAAAVVGVGMAQPGTLANPYKVPDSGTRTLDFTMALFLALEPLTICAAPDAPSVWYQFTESMVADLTASTSGFADGATIELYSGPADATVDELTLITTDGSTPIDLGGVGVQVLTTVYYQYGQFDTPPLELSL